jgi:hypothetical protein
MMKKNLLPLLLLLIPFFCFSQTKDVSVTITGGISNSSIKKKIEANTSTLFSAINTAYLFNKTDIKLSEKYATINAIEQINEFWDKNAFYCTTNSIKEQLLGRNNLYQMRNIPCVFGNDEQLDVVINYTSDGIINDFYVALELNQYKNVMDAKGVVDQTRREIILNFIENLRTSYIKKDIDFIETLYSDNALIITGKVIKKANGNSDYMRNNLSNKQVEYQVSTKKEYIERLKGIFSNTPYLKLDFNSIDVTRHKKYSNFYGVLLKQRWATPNYVDNGILFFLIQFRDEEDPIIWVRTWQDANETTESEVLGFHNFKIVTGEFYN